MYLVKIIKTIKICTFINYMRKIVMYYIIYELKKLY